MKASTSGGNAERQLGAFIRKFSPLNQRLHSCGPQRTPQVVSDRERTGVRQLQFLCDRLLPDRTAVGCHRLNGGSRKRRQFYVLSTARRLPDPKKLLLGSGNKTRFIRIDSPQDLERPEVKALVAAAIAQARAPLPVAGRGKLIIRSVSAKQRPRRKTLRSSVTR